MKNSDDEESTSKEILSLLSNDAYKEFARSIEKLEQNQPQASSLYSVTYDERLPIPCDNLPAFLSPADLTGILQRTDSRFGTIHNNYLVFNMPQPGETGIGRLIIIDDPILQAIYPDSSLTPAEIRTLKQILCGLSLRDAATEDCLSHETKRSHFKALCDKVGLRRQTDVVSYTLTQLLAANLRVDAKHESHNDVRAYHLEYMPPNTRLHILVGDSGQHHRIVDMGPIDGTTMICLHPQIFPGIRAQDVELLHARNIRLLWPLRHGQMSLSDPVLEFTDHIAHSNQSIDMARSLQLNPDEAILVTLVSGGFYGIEYALQNPLVDRIIFVGASYKPDVSGTLSDRFRYGLIKLATSNRALAKKLLHFMGRKFRDKSMLIKFFLNLYSECRADLQVLDEEFSSDKRTTAMQRRILDSENSIVHDFLAHVTPNWQALSSLSGKFVFVHGQYDSAHSIDDIKALATRHNAPVRELEELGQLLYYDNFGPLLDCLSEQL